MRHMQLLAMILMASVAAEAASAADKGWYSGLMGGLAFGNDAEVDLPGGADPNGTDLGTKSGFALDAFGGYDFGPFRTELEVAHRNVPAELEGRYKAYSLMSNALFDAAVADSDINLYGGIGAGVANVVFDGVTSPNVSGAVNADDAGFAYQFIAGIRYPLGDKLSGHLDYRHFRVDDVTARGSLGQPMDANFSSHTVMVGLSVLFGGPRKAEAAPVAEPAPPPEPKRQAQPEPMPEEEPETAAPEPPAVPSGPFLVFFDWDSAVISPDAREVLDQAVESYEALGAARIRLLGHADRSGAQQYNQELSVRRAEAVRQTLINAGIRSADIDLRGFGEARPLVPTPDDMREPQNRRVEIVLEE